MIDWEQVFIVMVGDEDPLLFPADEIADAVYKAGIKYSEKDQGVLGVEQYFKFERAGQNHSGIIDIFGRSPNGLYIVDWKTTGSFTDNWIFRESNSEQPLQYVHGLFSLGIVEVEFPVTVFIRGVTRGGSFKALTPRTIYAEDLAAYDEQQAKWQQVYETQAAGGWSDPWTRNQPDACIQFGFGHVCPFYDRPGHCVQPNVSREQLVNLEPPNLSHSFMKNFKRCPELARLLTLNRKFGILEDESEALTWGLAFHRGIAEVYKQLMEDGNGTHEENT